MTLVAKTIPGQPGARILSSGPVNVAGQPASRYWTFQRTETAIYLVLALAMAGYCFRRLNHRLS